MPLLKPPKEEQQVKIKLSLDEELYNKIEEYRKLAKFKNINSVIVEAIKRAFRGDREFNKHWNQLKKGGESK